MKVTVKIKDWKQNTRIASMRADYNIEDLRIARVTIDSAINKLLYEKWWLSPEYRFGQAPFIPDCINSEMLNDWSHRSRQTFYSIFSILKRSFNFSSNSCNIQRICFYFGINFMLRKEIAQKKGLPLGEQK